MTIKILAVRPIISGTSSMSAKAYERKLRSVVHKEKREAGKELRKPTRAWKEKPKFQRKNISNKAVIGEKISTRDTKYSALNTGTKKRWAVMSKDFVSKTSPNSMTSRRGRGGPVIRGRKAMQKRRIPAMPGIIARNWTKMVAKKRRPIFKKDVQVAIAEAASS